MTSLYGVNYHLRTHKRDSFIDFVKSLLLSPFILSENTTDRYKEIFQCLEELINEHIALDLNGQGKYSKLIRLVPSIGRFFTPLPLSEAFTYVNEHRSMTGRRFVPPSFNDIRHLLNRAQILAIAKNLKLITFDGDMTLYADGANFDKDSALVQLIINLLVYDIRVAIVTAAGYPGNAKRYEQRLSGLLEGLSKHKKHAQFNHFYVLGGECHYLFRYNPKSKHLEEVKESVYQPEFIAEWAKDDDRIQKILDEVEKHANQRILDLKLQDKVSGLRKNRSFGVYPKPGFEIAREQLDELALSMQARLNHFQALQIQERITIKKRKADFGNEDVAPIPFCAFNGGSDVWVDIGNKLIGVKILLNWLRTGPEETLHVGDQFLSTGNDIATRR